jgi:hypothetical protein
MNVVTQNCDTTWKTTLGESCSKGLMLSTTSVSSESLGFWTLSIFRISK